MWIEPEAAAHRRMARRAIALGMARRAGLETLARGLTVSKAEAAKCVVEAGLANSRISDEARLLMTTLAELRGIVAIAAVCLTGERRAGVAS